MAHGRMRARMHRKKKKRTMLHPSCVFWLLIIIPPTTLMPAYRFKEDAIKRAKTYLEQFPLGLGK